jgi:hypothetical protein
MPGSQKEVLQQIKQARELLNQSKELLKKPKACKTNAKDTR